MSVHSRRWFCVWGLVMIWFGVADAQTPPEPVCVLLTAEGKVEVAAKGTVAWQPARTNQVLRPGDLLRTGRNSRASVQWSGLSVLRVNALTSMEIQPPPKAGGQPELELKSGASYFFSRERPGEIQFR